MFSKIVFKIVFFVIIFFVILFSCYVLNEVNYDILFEIKDKVVKLFSDIIFYNVLDYIKVNKFLYIDFEFILVM